MIPWFVRLKALYHSETAYLAKQGFERIDDELRVVFRGEIVVATEAGNARVPVQIAYPEDFPFAPPELVPLRALTDPEPRMFSMRHQMSGGALCLYELHRGAGRAEAVLAADAIRRARRWLAGALRGTFSTALDSREADLENHYSRSGNIFLGPALLDSPPKRNGRFIARKLSRPEGHPTFFVTHVERDVGWADERALARRLALPGLTDVAKGWWDEVTSTSSLEAAYQDDTMLVGRWYDVDSEPPPIRTVTELAALLHPHESTPLSAFARAFAVERARSANIVVALRFPARGHRHEERDLLFLILQPREKTRELVPAPGMKAKGVVLGDPVQDRWTEREIKSLRSQDLRRRSLEVRNTGRVPATTEQMTLSVLGVGALGSACTELLVKAGCGLVRIWDHGCLDAGNVVRHVACLGWVGLPKTHATLFSLVNINPHVELTTEPRRAHTWQAGGVAPPWSEQHILSTIADDAEELAFNVQAVDAGATVYYLRGLRRGTAARLIRVRPGHDACLECCALHARDGDQEFIEVDAAEDEVVAHECGQPVLAASAADLAVMSGMGVRFFLDDVASGGALNQWVWTTTGISGAAGLESPFSLKTTTVRPHPGCTTCGERSVVEVIVPHGIRADLVDQATTAAPNETGGILVGRRTGASVEVIAASGPGPNAVRSPTGFTRDGAFCQAFLDDAVRRNAGVDYVGEWHSHPGADSEPSPRDTKSLDEIALDPNFITSCPISLIVGLPDGTSTGAQLGCTSQPVVGRGGLVNVNVR